jgi:carboxylesterase type B
MYQETFLNCAEKMGIAQQDRSSTDIAEDMIVADLDKIRAANFVGAPCTFSEILPYEKPTMQLMRSKPSTQVDWLDSQIISSCTYDGSISYIITHNSPKRKNHAQSFVALAQKLLKDPDQLLDLYSIRETDQDDEALRKICLFESDIGFVSAAVAQAEGCSKKTKTYLQIFDLGNPFEGLLEQHEFATHTWDIVALLGAYEDRLSARYVKVIRAWREKTIKFIVDDDAPVDGFDRGRHALLVDIDGVREAKEHELPGAERRSRLWQLAESEKGAEGPDFLWEGVCRRWLDVGS